MKQILLFAATLMVCSSFAQTKTLNIRGTVADTTLNGKMVYLLNYHNKKAIDSCKVADGKFSFTHPADDLYIVRLDLARLYANVIVDDGVIEVAMGNPSTVGGTPLNRALGEFDLKMEQINAYFKKTFNDKSLSESQRDSIRNAAQNATIVMQDSLLHQNMNNPLGVFSLWSMMSYDHMTTNKIDSLTAIMGPMAQNFGPVFRIRQAKAEQEKTDEGKMFVDFEGVGVDGAPAHLSDYVGRGQYVLADFWASWCGPCLEELPNLKQIYNTYKDKGLVMLGVNVWDEKQACTAAIQTHGMSWNHICDFGGQTAVKCYGIQSIPQVILFAPDGTIIARDLRGAKISKLLDRFIK